MQFGKIDIEILDSSLIAAGGWLPTYIFMMMVTASDKDGYLRKDPRAFYRRLGFDIGNLVSYDDYEKALAYLANEDRHSNLKAHDGRRIVPLSKLDDVEGDRGFLIVNKTHYRDKGRNEDRRTQNRENKRAQRGRETDGRSLADNLLCESPGQANAERNTVERFREFWEVYPRKKDRARAEKIWKRMNLNQLANKIIGEVKWHATNSNDWQEWTDNPDQEKRFQYVPYACSYLRGERWKDERYVDMSMKPLGANRFPTADCN